MYKRHFIILILLISVFSLAKAQVGEYRNRFAVGITGGYNMSSVGFQPTVIQSNLGGMTAGIVGRYTSEKYFSTICSVQIECNLSQAGWKEDILTINDEPVINPDTKLSEKYQRTITYVQIPMLAHLAWGKEEKGFNGFINLGPQIGFCIDENSKKNYDKPFTKAFYPDIYSTSEGRINQTITQEEIPVENKFDYGITLGAGIEAHIKHFGRISLEGRYYYGLGNMYGDSKKDFFGKSNNSIIYIRMAYLYDL